MFQEYHPTGLDNRKFIFAKVRFMWIVLTMFISMAFVGNLKSSLVKKNFEKRLMTMTEMVEKDLVLHTSTATLDFYDDPNIASRPLYQRLKCQTYKHKSLYISGYDYSTQRHTCRVVDLDCTTLQKAIFFEYCNLKDVYFSTEMIMRQ